MNKYNSLKILKKFNSVCIIGHTSPDVDDVGSMLALKQFLLDKFKLNADLFLDCNHLSTILSDMVGKTKLNPKPAKYDCAIRIDSTTIERLGKFGDLYLSAPFKINIDHHATNDMIGNINIIETISSSCELMYKIMESYHYTPNRDTLSNIYAGILTDTNGFSVGPITANTFKVAADCSEKIDIGKIYQKYLSEKTLLDMQLMAEAIFNIEQFLDGQIVFTQISQKTLDKYNASREDGSIIPNILRNIKNTKIFCMVTPTTNANYISLRSNGYNIGDLAKKHGGGGHPEAAGIILDLPYEKIKNLLLPEFKKIIKNK